MAALELMREQCLRLIESRLEQLAGRLSLSERLTGPAPGLEPILAAGRARFPELAAQLDVAEPGGALPPRAHLHARAHPRHAHACRAADTPSPRSCWRTCDGSRPRCARGRGRSPPARTCATSSARWRCSAFTSPASTSASTPGSTDARWPRSTARCVSARTTRHWPSRAASRCSRPRSRTGARSSPPTSTASPRPPRRRSGCSGRCARRLEGPNRGAIQTFIVSGSEGPADILEVLLLMKEASLCRAGGGDAQLRVVPLFEAGATLEAAPADDGAAARHARLPGGAARRRRRAGGDGRLLGLQQGRRLPGVGVGRLHRSGAHRGGAEPPRRELVLLPRPRRRRRPRRRARPTAPSWRCRPARSAAA